MNRSYDYPSYLIVASLLLCPAAEALALPVPVQCCSEAPHLPGHRTFEPVVQFYARGTNTSTATTTL
jgi:hypothetical protein